jgi:hypothetical protein
MGRNGNVGETGAHLDRGTFEHFKSYCCFEKFRKPVATAMGQQYKPVVSHTQAAVLLRHLSGCDAVDAYLEI